MGNTQFFVTGERGFQQYILRRKYAYVRETYTKSNGDVKKDHTKMSKSSDPEKAFDENFQMLQMIRMQTAANIAKDEKSFQSMGLFIASVVSHFTAMRLIFVYDEGSFFFREVNWSRRLATLGIIAAITWRAVQYSERVQQLQQFENEVHWNLSAMQKAYTSSSDSRNWVASLKQPDVFFKYAINKADELDVHSTAKERRLIKSSLVFPLSSFHSSIDKTTSIEWDLFYRSGNSHDSFKQIAEILGKHSVTLSKQRRSFC